MGPILKRGFYVALGFGLALVLGFGIPIRPPPVGVSPLPVTSAAFPPGDGGFVDSYVGSPGTCLDLSGGSSSLSAALVCSDYSGNLVLGSAGSGGQYITQGIAGGWLSDGGMEPGVNNVYLDGGNLVTSTGNIYATSGSGTNNSGVISAGYGFYATWNDAGNIACTNGTCLSITANGPDNAAGDQSDPTINGFSGIVTNVGVWLNGQGTGHLCWNASSSANCETGGAPWSVTSGGNERLTGTVTTGGVTLPHDQRGCDAGSTGLLSVTFATAYAGQPSCTCSDTNSTLNACDVTARATTGATFKATGSDVICWTCGDINSN